MVAASPRNWSSALCRYARYWISGTGSRPPMPEPAASPRMDVSSSRVSNTRSAPNRSRNAFVTPYTPPLAATSSPNSTMPGLVTRASVSVALMVWARVSPSAFSGNRPPKASARAPRLGPSAASAASATTRATRTGRRGASGATTSAVLVSLGSAMTSSAIRRTCHPTSS